MVFSSLVFLCIFLPVVLILHTVIGNLKAKNGLLLAASLLFYAYGEPVYVFLMLLSALYNYIFALIVEKNHSKLVLTLAVIVNLGMLAVFKYTGFILTNINALLGIAIPVPAITLPIGISFFTFQAMSYVIDVYRNEVGAQRNYAKVLLYISFFPQLIAGPIVRYVDIAREIDDRSVTLSQVAFGLRRFLVGLAKKVLISNAMAAAADYVFNAGAANINILAAWIGAIAYLMQIYYDFSGYSDMAIGLGKMFGFHFKENFNHPYIADTVQDFWRRWHISLSSWFRDYIYIPLGGNRVSRSRWIFNICAVWLLTGLWHGAEWNFVLWGGYYALLLLIDKLFLGRLLARLPKLLSGLFTFFWVTLGWVLFNADGLAPALENLRIMFSGIPSDLFAAVAADSSLLYALIYIPLGLVCIFPWAKRIKLPDSLAGESLKNAASLALFGMSLVYLVSSGFNPFIYFRF